MSKDKINIKLESGKCLFTEKGKGLQNLILIHGLSLNIGFGKLASKLSSKYRVLIPDLPFASEETYSKKHTLENYVEYINEFCEELGLKKVNLFGNSLGGGLSLFFASKYPRKVDKIIARAPFFTFKQLPFVLRSKSSLKLYEYLTKNTATFKWMQKIFLSRYRNLSKKGECNDLELILERVSEKFNSDKFINNLKELLFCLTRLDISERVKRVKNETLLMWGESDAILDVSWAYKLHSMLANSKLDIRKGGYHNITTENFDTLAKDIKNFLN